VEFLGASNLEILNRGNEPTFCNGHRSEVTVITLGSFELLESIMSWEVPLEPSLSDHRHILFTLWDSMPAHLITNPRGTNWDSFRGELKDMLSRGPMMSIEDEAGLGLALNWVQHALTTAYKDNCPP
jgi:hypothetical protein